MKNIFTILGAALMLPLSVTALAADTRCSAQSLIDAGDGTVIDRLNGLMWTQCSYGYVRSVDNNGDVSCVNELDENGDEVSITTSFNTALSSLSAATPSGYFATAGHTDWRLPNIKELWSIVDDCYGRDTNGFVDPAYFPDQYVGTPQSSSYLPDHFATSTPVTPGIIGNDNIHTTTSNICLQMKGDNPWMGACARYDTTRLRLVRDLTPADVAALPAK